jgi:lysophospholipase L1-like esterase
MAGFLMPPSAVSDAAPRRSLSRRRKLLFIGICLLLILVFQEVLSRLVLPLPEVDGFNRTQYMAYDRDAPALAQFRRAGMGRQTIRHESAPDGFTFDHVLNIYGFRGPDFRVNPPRDRPRIVFVGDSLTEGVGAAAGDTIPEQFARLVGRDSPVEAINLGVCGAGLAEYERLVRDSLVLLRPDVICLTLFVNDLPVDRPANPPAPVPAFPRGNPFVPRLVAVALRIRQGLPVYRAWRSRPRPANHPVPSPFNPLTTQPPPPGADPVIVEAMRRGRCNPGLAWHPPGYDRMLRHDLSRDDGGASAILGRIAQDCLRHRTRLLLAYVPASAVVNPAYMVPMRRLNPEGIGSRVPIHDPIYLGQQRYLGRVTRALGIPFLDLTGPFQEAEIRGRRLYWPYDPHPNAAGYHLVAEVYARHWRLGDVPEPVTRLASRSTINTRRLKPPHRPPASPGPGTEPAGVSP